MASNYNFRLLIVFFVAASLASLSGPMSNGFHLPTVQLAHANRQACIVVGVTNSCSEPWYPAGPAMNTLEDIIFTDNAALYTGLQNGNIDFTDTPCPPALCSILQTSPNFLVTAPIPQTGYYEIEYLLTNNFWGCQFMFGNANCGIQIRQGVAHMMDRASFATNDPSLAGTAQALDNPVPTSSIGGLPTPNPCSYDASFPQTGSNCIVGAPGGTSYHLGTSAGTDGYPWLYRPGSADLNAAAQHFVNAGIATGFNSTTSILTGISSAALSNPVNFFIRNDDPARLHLGQGLEAQICYLFTGSYAAPCQYLTVVLGPASAFPGFTTCDSCTSLNWWMYTAAFAGPTFFDGSLYFTYNSRFVSGIPAIQQPIGPCSPQSVPTQSASDYMYLCSPSFDNLSNQMETAPCLAATGDPSPGQPNNGPGADCSGTSQLSAISAGIQAEAIFGAGAFTLPVFERTVQFGYLNGWSRAINDAGQGIPNYFTWLNAYNPSPAVPGTIRQGFSQTTRSVNPYIASTAWDQYMVNNVYDSLYKENPLNHAQQINWMTLSTLQLSNSSLTYTAPPHTLTTYRFTLRSDMFFQDGTPVTSYDVAFSYLSLVGSGSFLGTGASTMSGITILNSHQFDIGVNSIGPFVLASLTEIPILPGHYWSNAGSSSWNNAISTCASTTSCSIGQYTLSSSTVNCSLNCSPFSVALMTFNPVDASPTFDPIVNHTFVGSGPWQCGIVSVLGSGVCASPTNTQNPPVGGSFTLTRFGSGLPPASSISGIYFRSSGNLALYIWTEENDVSPILPFASVASCFDQLVNLSGPCAHWQQGFGGIGPVGVSQVAAVARFYNVNWLAPYEWLTSPPLGIGSFPPVLYEGLVTLSPASSVGCPSGYDC